METWSKAKLYQSCSHKNHSARYVQTARKEQSTVAKSRKSGCSRNLQVLCPKICFLCFPGAGGWTSRAGAGRRTAHAPPTLLPAGRQPLVGRVRPSASPGSHISLVPTLLAPSPCQPLACSGLSRRRVRRSESVPPRRRPPRVGARCRSAGHEDAWGLLQRHEEDAWMRPEGRSGRCSNRRPAMAGERVRPWKLMMRLGREEFDGKRSQWS